MWQTTPIGLPPEVQHAARTRDDGEPSLQVYELLTIAMPTAPELGYAVRKGWLDAVQLAAIVTGKQIVDAALTDAETRLLLSEIGTEQFTVEAAATRVPDVALESYWLYVLMTWGLRVWPQTPSRSRLVEAIFIALDKPHQIESFAWMARRWGPKVGLFRSRRRMQLAAWRAYLASEAPYFDDRATFQRAR